MGEVTGLRVVDVIPSSDSAETFDNSEPSIAVDPLDTNEIVAGAFGVFSELDAEICDSRDVRGHQILHPVGGDRRRWHDRDALFDLRSEHQLIVAAAADDER